SATPRPRTCSSSTRSPAMASTICLRPTPRPKTASPRCSSLLRSWAARLVRRRSTAPATPHAVVGAAAVRDGAGRGGERVVRVLVESAWLSCQHGPANRQRQSDRPEQRLRIEVILTGFIDNSQHAVLVGGGIAQRYIDFPLLERNRVALIVYAN